MRGNAIHSDFRCRGMLMGILRTTIIEFIQQARQIVKIFRQTRQIITQTIH